MLFQVTDIFLKRREMIQLQIIMHSFFMKKLGGILLFSFRLVALLAKNFGRLIFENLGNSTEILLK